MVTRYFKPEAVPFDFESAYKFLKIRKTSDMFVIMHELVEDLFKQYRDIFEPCYRYKISKVTGGQSGTFSILLEDGLSFTGEGIHRVLTHSHYAASFVITVGKKIDDELAVISNDDFTEAFFLDGIASTMTHGIQQLLERELLKEAKKLSCELGSRFAPGYAKWELTEQKKLFDLLKAEEIGMQLSESFFMIPQKSISGVYGLKHVSGGATK